MRGILLPVEAKKQGVFSFPDPTLTRGSKTVSGVEPSAVVAQNVRLSFKSAWQFDNPLEDQRTTDSVRKPIE